jgi:hypothetical protein
MLEPPTVLNRPVVRGVDRFATERDFCHLRPTRVDQSLTGDGDKVGAALARKMASAKCGSTIWPTAIDMIAASLRTRAAKGTWPRAFSSLA